MLLVWVGAAQDSDKCADGGQCGAETQAIPLHARGLVGRQLMRAQSRDLGFLQCCPVISLLFPWLHGTEVLADDNGLPLSGIHEDAVTLFAVSAVVGP